MKTIRIPVESIKLTLSPDPTAKQKPGGGPRLKGLDNGLTLPSPWTSGQIKKAFRQANEIWAQAGIKFDASKLKDRTVAVPADDTNMWIAFQNKLAPRKGGLSASFVFDLPSGKDGGWGGGRIAVVSGERAKGAIDSYAGAVLAHELGHCLLGHEHVKRRQQNLMFRSRDPQTRYGNNLDSDQIKIARAKAPKLV